MRTASACIYNAEGRPLVGVEARRDAGSLAAEAAGISCHVPCGVGVGGGGVGWAKKVSNIVFEERKCADREKRENERRFSVCVCMNRDGVKHMH